MQFDCYPLLFKPLFINDVWGSDTIKNTLKREGSQSFGRPISQSLEIVDNADKSSVIENGTYKNQTLNQLIENCADKLISIKHKKTARFPITIKYLGISCKTSVKVHPSNSKFWYILEGSKDAKCYVGLQEKVRKEFFVTKMNDSSILDCLQRFPIRSGDSYNVLPGQVHCLTGQSTLLEVQDNNDLSFRFFDWNRQRDTATQQALKATNFHSKKSALIRATSHFPDRNIRTNLSSLHPNFIIQKLSITERYSTRTTDTCQIVIPLSASIEIVYKKKRYPIGQYCPTLLPCATGEFSIIPTKKTSLIIVKLKL